MINGPIIPKLAAFCFPLMMSGMLQLLFNAVDLVVVGRFTGSDALAAVGATTSLIHMIVNLFVGISVGANVQAARYIARGENDKLSTVVHTSIGASVIAGLFVMAAGIAITPFALKAMGTPADIIGMSSTYMRIYFLGMPFFMVYNFGAAILRAAGDTKRPLSYLTISGLLNAALNMVLVIVFRLGVVGVAAATVFSQLVSCVLIVLALIRSDSHYRLCLSELRIDTRMLLTISRIGIPAGLQSTVISFSNALLQSSVNSLGASAMAGFTAANNVMAFFFVCVNAISQTCMTFTSQNYGAGKPDRMKSILRSCLLLEFAVAFSIGALGTAFSRQLLGIYCNSEEVLAYGIAIAPECFLTYFICSFMDCLAFRLRGLGRSTVPMLLSVLGTVGTRVIWVMFFFPLRRDIQFLMLCYPISWSITVLMQSIALYFVGKNVYLQLSVKNAH